MILGGAVEIIFASRPKVNRWRTSPRRCPWPVRPSVRSPTHAGARRPCTATARREEFPRANRGRPVPLPAAVLFGGPCSLSTYVNRGRAPTSRELARAALRRTTALELRTAGFAVVHTPGAIIQGPHVSVVWPGSDPFRRQEASWEIDVQEKFSACFNEEEG
jgi:hypothetical protein